MQALADVYSDLGQLEQHLRHIDGEAFSGWQKKGSRLHFTPCGCGWQLQRSLVEVRNLKMVKNSLSHACASGHGTLLIEGAPLVPAALLWFNHPESLYSCN